MFRLGLNRFLNFLAPWDDSRSDAGVINPEASHARMTVIENFEETGVVALLEAFSRALPPNPKEARGRGPG